MKFEEEQLGNSDPQVDEEGKLQIGPFLFTNDISLTLKRRLKHLYRPYKAKTQALRIQNGRVNELIPEDALQLAESYTFQHLQTIQLTNNKIQSLSFLHKCNFPNLLVLNLSRNYLWDLTDIWNHLHFPNLEHIYLHNNHINNIRGIKRWRLPQLSKLTFELNFIISLKQLSEADLPALRQLLLYSNHIGDFRPIFKAQFPNLQIFQIYENAACDGNIISAILPNKFKFLGRD